MLDKWKRQDDGTVEVKSRIVLVGWKDPMVYQLERAARTPTQVAIMVTLQWLAPAKVSGKGYGLDQRIWAVTQDIRRNKLATRLPPGVTHPSVGPGQLLLVETEIHGLVSGPRWLRARLTVDLLAAGYVKNPYDKCLFTLFSFGEISEGQMLIDVDDFIERGKETHRNARRFSMKKYRLFAGSRVVQHHDYRVTVSMEMHMWKTSFVRLECQIGFGQIPKK